MTQQRTVGTREQLADVEEQIPASEFREFMQEMREFKKDITGKVDGLVKDVGSLKRAIGVVAKIAGGIGEMVEESEVKNPHKWEDVGSAEGGGIIGSRAQECLYCKATRIVQVLEDGSVSVVGTNPPGLTDECDMENS